MHTAFVMLVFFLGMLTLVVFQQGHKAFKFYMVLRKVRKHKFKGRLADIQSRLDVITAEDYVSARTKFWYALLAFCGVVGVITTLLRQMS